MGKNDRVRPRSNAARRLRLKDSQMPLTSDRRPRKSNNLFDSTSDDEATNFTGWSELSLISETEQNISCDSEDLDSYVDALYEKRGSTRELALSELIKAFEKRVLCGFVKNKSVALAHRCLNSMKRGSPKEVLLASRAIGLLALTAGCGSHAHEILQDSIPHFSQVLKTRLDPTQKSSVIESLAILAFVGAEYPEEIESSMSIIWESIHPKPSSDVKQRKPSPVVLAVALSAWSFLLALINEWRISSTIWKGSISFLSGLLEKEDHSVGIVAGEAVALIYEIDRIDKFSNDDNNGIDSLDHEGREHHREVLNESLKDKILNKARSLSSEAIGKGYSKKNLNNQRKNFQRVLAFVETAEFDEISVEITKNCNHLVVSTWAQLLKFNFLSRFLGKGYLPHMQHNEVLHDVFDYVPRTREKLSLKEKRLFLPSSSSSIKERTQYRNNSRTLTQNKKQGHFVVAVECE